MADGDRLRLFCALLLPAPAADALAAWSARHLHGGRPVPRENLHVTLAFLGARPADELPAIAAELRSAAAAAAPVVLAPERYRETRSAGMVVLSDERRAAAALAADVAARLERLGVFRPDGRAWLPHVTVLRYRARPRLAPPLPERANICPSDAAVMVSVLRPDGARYEAREHAALGNAALGHAALGTQHP